MQEDDNVNLDTPNETVEETVETPTETETTEETLETPEVDVVQLQATNKKLYERAKKAEADLKALKGSNPPSTTAKTSPQPTNVDERILLANGMPKELISELKAVAQVRNIDILEAQNDSLFVAIKEKFEKEKRQKEASMGASRGAKTATTPKKASSPGLSREEHMRLAKEAL